MLRDLTLRNVGPAKSMQLDIGQRINVITGDNGLGKSFLLEIAWWALTQTWANAMPQPTDLGAQLRANVEGGTFWLQPCWSFQSESQSWSVSPVENGIWPKLSPVIYAQLNGHASIWDPFRNAGGWFFDASKLDRPELFRFGPNQIFEGLKSDGRTYCNGLFHDCVAWQREHGEAIRQLESVLSCLSPSLNEQLQLGRPTRISLNDVRDIPTIRMSYHQDVPVPSVAAGIRRILSLAYLLVWCWQEHCRAAEFLKTEPIPRIVLLIDEIECHLHPRWQRVILESLLNVMQAMTGTSGVEVQLLCVTHSPLILASLEPVFDEQTDRLFHIRQDGAEVHVDQVPWAKQGDVTNWLVSDVFGLKQGRSRQAEQAIEAAEAWMRGDTAALPAGLESQDLIHAALLRTLPGHDDFWPRWVVTTKQVAGVRP